MSDALTTAITGTSHLILTTLGAIAIAKISRLRDLSDSTHKLVNARSREQDEAIANLKIANASLERTVKELQKTMTEINRKRK